MVGDYYCGVARGVRMYVSPGCSMPSAPRDTSFSNVRDIPRGQPSARVLPRAQRMVLGMVPPRPSSRSSSARRLAPGLVACTASRRRCKR